jgi:uncharacterized protein YqeY
MQPQLEQDLKQAMLAGEKAKVETLKGIKTALQYEAVSLRVPKEELTDEQIQKVLARESKKRNDSIQLYQRVGEAERAAAETAEKSIIDGYLPAQLDESAIAAAVEEEVATVDNPTPADMGKIIGAIKQKLGASADGATIARLVKERLSQ